MDVLRGVRVVDLEGDVAGAYAAKLLAAAGADVVRVERPGGDPTRRFSPRVTDGPDGSTLAAYLHTGKRSAVFDWSDQRDLEDLRRLLAGADLVIETGAPGEWARRGIDLRAMAVEDPRLIVCSITPFGQDGPRSSWRATALTALAAGGQLSLCGDPDRPPLKVAGHQAYYQAGLSAFGACLAALFAKRRTGVGDHIDISVQEVQAGNLEVAGPMALARGVDTVRTGNLLRPTWGIYPCADGHVGVAAMVRQTGTVFRCIGHSELADDPAFSDLRRDETAMEVTQALILEWTMARTARQVFEDSQAFRGPFSMIPGPRELMEWPPLVESGFWAHLDHPVLGRHTMPGIPFTVDGCRPQVARAPLLGEHTAEVRAELAGRTPAAARGGAPRAAPALPFEGIRVLDLSQVWAGPFGARFLAEMGADVIHVEGPAFPDAVRATGRTADPRWFNKGPVFNEYNRDKRGIVLDLRRPEGREALLRLARTADVVVENWSAGVAERLGLGFEDLRAVNPRLVFVQMPAFGQSPPESERMGYGPTVEQMGGIVALQGYEGGPPHKGGVSYGDPTAGMMGAAAIVLGLLQREATGVGTHIVLSQRDNIAAMVGEFFVAESLGALPPTRIGNRDLDHAPHGVYRAADDRGRFQADDEGKPADELHETWVAIAVDSDEAWAALCEVLDDARLRDPRYERVEGRRADEAAIDAVIAEHARRRDAAELAAALQAAGVSAMPVLTPLMITLDEHLRARGYITSTEHPEAGRHLTTAPTWRLARRPSAPPRPAPRFGEHTDEVLRELGGYDDAAVARLRQAGVTADEPVE